MIIETPSVSGPCQGPGSVGRTPRPVPGVRRTKKYLIKCVVPLKILLENLKAAPSTGASPWEEKGRGPRYLRTRSPCASSDPTKRCYFTSIRLSD
eukprot:768700-Hanusia_phi.AAC.6